MPPPDPVFLPISSDNMSDLGKVSGSAIILSFALFSLAIAFFPLVLFAWGFCEITNYFIQRYKKNQTVKSIPHPYKIHD